MPHQESLGDENRIWQKLDRSTKEKVQHMNEEPQYKDVCNIVLRGYIGELLLPIVYADTF